MHAHKSAVVPATALPAVQPDRSGAQQWPSACPGGKHQVFLELLNTNDNCSHLYCQCRRWKPPFAKQRAISLIQINIRAIPVACQGRLACILDELLIIIRVYQTKNTMYICLCNGITDRDISCVQQGCMADRNASWEWPRSAAAASRTPERAARERRLTRPSCQAA
jgi:hypothetical protein